MAFSRRWSDQQQLAIELAALDHGYTAPQTWKAALAGTLPGVGNGLEPMDIPLSTVRAYQTAARKTQTTRINHSKTAEETLSSVVIDIAQLLRTQVGHLQKKAAKGDLTPGRIGDIATAATKLVNLQKAMHGLPTTTTKKPTEPSEGPELPKDFISELAAVTDQGERPRNPASQPGTDAEGEDALEARAGRTNGKLEEKRERFSGRSAA